MTTNQLFTDHRPDGHDWHIAIPTHDRTDIVQSKTLAMLHRMGVAPDRITLFVGTDAEANDYRNALPENTYGHIALGAPGGVYQRNRIHLGPYYDEGDLVLCIDDDIKALKVLNTQGKLVSLEDDIGIDELMSIVRSSMGIKGAKLCGIYPVLNSLFMSRTMSFDLRFCPGGTYAMIVDKNPKLKLRSPVKVDYENTLRHFVVDGCVVRLNFVAFDTRYYEGAGGYNNTRRPEHSERATRYLMGKFPKYVKRRPSSRGHSQVKLVSPWRDIVSI